MARYLTTMTLTTQAWAAYLQKPQNRAEAIRPMVDALGGKLVYYWYGVDSGKIYVVHDGIDDLIAREAMYMAVLGGGAVATLENTRILTAEEAMEAMKKANSVVYRSPTATGGQTAAKK